MFRIFPEDKKAIDDLLKELLAVPVGASTAVRQSFTWYRIRIIAF